METISNDELILGQAEDVADELAYNIGERFKEDSHDADNLVLVRQWMDVLIELRKLPYYTLVKVEWDYSQYLSMTVYKAVTNE